MANKRDVIAEELNSLADDLERLWRAATQDPKKEARRRRTWMIVSGILSAASTMAGRKIAAKVWPILTGETPPVPNLPPAPAPSEPRDRSEQPTAV
jgi:hypothetical protein